MAHPKDDDPTEQQTLDVSSARHARLLAFWDGGFASRPLPDRGSLTIGRSLECDVRIDHTSVSRKHATLHLGGAPRIEDLGSSNGIRIGGQKVLPGSTTTLSPGEAIELGSVILVLQPGNHVPLPQVSTPSAPTGYSRPTAPPPPITEATSSMANLQRLVGLVAKGTISVLLLGETGVGKEVMADSIHRLSPRASHPLLRLNCAALTETLLESELFGHERGAFTGAVQAKPGLLEAADKGTLFFDEVGELPLSTQAKLLRVLESREVQRVGSLKPKPIDVRFIAATNRDLRARCVTGAFREDLFYRLNGITLTIPPLRERVSEIAPLAKDFAERAAAEMSKPAMVLTPQAVVHLEGYAWPGNVRELKNVIERAVLITQGDRIDVEHLELEAPAPQVPPPAPSTAAIATREPAGVLKHDVEEFERQRIAVALEQCGGNQTRAARVLGISRRTLLARLDAYGLPRPRK